MSEHAEKPSLLIVDDERHTREGLRRALQDHFEIYLAADAPGALAVLETESISLVLTDLKMSGEKDGMKLLEKCQSLAGNSRTDTGAGLRVCKE